MNVETLIDQLTLFTVNVADGRRGSNDTSQPGGHGASGRAVLSFVHCVRPLSLVTRRYQSGRRVTSESFSIWLAYQADDLTAPRGHDCRRRSVRRDDFEKARTADNTKDFVLFGFAVISAKGGYLAITDNQLDSTEIAAQHFASEASDAVAEAINVNDACLDRAIAQDFGS